MGFSTISFRTVRKIAAQVFLDITQHFDRFFQFVFENGLKFCWKALMQEFWEFSSYCKQGIFQFLNDDKCSGGESSMLILMHFTWKPFVKLQLNWGELREWAMLSSPRKSTHQGTPVPSLLCSDDSQWAETHSTWVISWKLPSQPLCQDKQGSCREQEAWTGAVRPRDVALVGSGTGLCLPAASGGCR